MARSETQNMTMVILLRRRALVRELVLHRPETSAGSERQDGGISNSFPTRTDADEPIDVKSAKQENECVNRTEDGERDRRLGRGQEWRHGIRGSQHSIDHPGLTADLSGEPAGDDRNKGQWKARGKSPKAAGDCTPVGACSSDSCRARRAPASPDRSPP